MTKIVQGQHWMWGSLRLCPETALRDQSFAFIIGLTIRARSAVSPIMSCHEHHEALGLGAVHDWVTCTAH